ncbi:MAG: Mur ligase family protein [Bacteroidales bacterium]|nr:Mur ligase family protein [Bacteroidales bacterium]
MHLYFIAIGGSAMHNLAIALASKGYRVSGSDDEIFEPSKSRLARYGLLPEKLGWDASRITSGLDAIILGMHAKADNPELLRARELGLKIFSYPEFLYEQSKDKKRVVIGGSHGKTTITAMILHALRQANLDCDYLVGAQLEGFDVMVKLTQEATVMIFEGDEYLTSPIDPRPKFHLYKPDIALLSGIAWDHINVFQTYDNYVDQFRIFINEITPGGSLIWCADDAELQRICPGCRDDITILPYALPSYEIRERQTFILLKENAFPLRIFGKHNLMNLEGARLVCNQLGIRDFDFYSAMQTFKGASKRLEIVSESETSIVFKDFAHAPSKVEATLKAVKEQFPSRKIVACLELHTYSSLNREFLGHYKGTLDAADTAIVYYNPHALALKGLPNLTPEQVKEGFSRNNLEVFNNVQLLLTSLNSENWKNSVLLMMSSGNYDGIDLKELGSRICGS